MLDLSAVKRQIDVMVAERVGATAEEEFRNSLEMGLAELDRWSGRGEELKAVVQASRTSWLLAELGSEPESVQEPPVPPGRISVSATDGSQIFPNRHEISSCYLINIGYALLHYGCEERPLLSSRPTVFAHDDRGEEAWSDRQAAHGRELVGWRRSLLEFTELAELSAASREEGNPTVALADGSLICWSLEGAPTEFRARYLESLRSAFELMRRWGVPVAGYISRARSRDLINSLRVGLCPLEVAHCDRCPYDATELPCAPFAQLVDANLMQARLERGERSAMYASRSRVLDDYGDDNRILFFYINTGDEVARVEVPRWVTADEGMMNTVHGVVMDQVDKGDGYPVCLTEAHEQAVIRGSERESFYRFLRDSFIMNDMNASFSAKSLKKRMPAV